MFGCVGSQDKQNCLCVCKPVRIICGAAIAAVICRVPLDLRDRVESKILHGKNSSYLSHTALF
jgi:hypothetical protein